MTVLGVVFRPQLPPERLRAVARAADDAGLEELWLWEDCFLEGGISAAAAALAWTERVRVGVGLLPVPLRNVAVTAMEAATLHRMFPGRAILGVGHGVQDWMGQVGARAESPVTLLREHLDALRALLRGERVSTDGRYVKLDGVALDWPPTGAPEVLAGATGPRSLRLSGAAADGTVLTAATAPEGVRRARRLIDEGGSRRAGPTTTGWSSTSTRPPDRTRRPGCAPRSRRTVRIRCRSTASPGTRTRSPRPYSASRRPAPTPWSSSPPPTNGTPRPSYGSRRRKYGRSSRRPVVVSARCHTRRYER